MSLTLLQDKIEKGQLRRWILPAGDTDTFFTVVEVLEFQTEPPRVFGSQIAAILCDGEVVVFPVNDLLAQSRPAT